MNRIRRAAVLFAAVVATLIAACMTGGGSGTGNANTITGVLVQPGGTMPAKCGVSLYRADAIPDTSADADKSGPFSDSTDDGGRFVLRNVPDGRYTIFCSDTARSLSKLIPGIAVNGRDSLFTGVDTLRVSDSFSGFVNNARGARTIAFVYGSPLFTTVNSASGAFRLNGIPSGDSIVVTFKALETIDGKTCETEYRFCQSPDTTLSVSVTLECN